MINIGKYIEMAINWLTENFAGLFDVINHIVGGFTYHYGRSEPDNHDGSLYGCDCGHDLGWRIR